MELVGTSHGRVREGGDRVAPKRLQRHDLIHNVDEAAAAARPVPTRSLADVAARADIRGDGHVVMVGEPTPTPEPEATLTADVLWDLLGVLVEAKQAEDAKAVNTKAAAEAGAEGE